MSSDTEPNEERIAELETEVVALRSQVERLEREMQRLAESPRTTPGRSVTW